MKKNIIALMLLLQSFVLASCTSFWAKADNCRTDYDLYVALSKDNDPSANKYLKNTTSSCAKYRSHKFDPNVDRDYNKMDRASKSLGMRYKLIQAYYKQNKIAAAEAEVLKFIAVMPEEPILQNPAYAVDVEDNESREQVARFYVEMLKKQKKYAEAEVWSQKAEDLNWQHRKVVANYEKSNRDYQERKKNQRIYTFEDLHSPSSTPSDNRTMVEKAFEKKCMCWVAGGAKQSNKIVQNIGGASSYQNVTTHSSGHMEPCYCK